MIGAGIPADSLQAQSFHDLLINGRPVVFCVFTPDQWERLQPDQRPPAALDEATGVRLGWFRPGADLFPRIFDPAT